jgi:hypothetical protein
MPEGTDVRSPVVPDDITIELAADASLGLTARVLVAAAARHFGLGDGSVEDLRIAVSELFSCGVETGGGQVRIGVGHVGPDVVLRVSGTGPVETAPPPEHGTAPVIARADLLRALFPNAWLTPDDGGTAVITVRIGP